MALVRSVLSGAKDLAWMGCLVPVRTVDGVIKQDSPGFYDVVARLANMTHPVTLALKLFV